MEGGQMTVTALADLLDVQEIDLEIDRLLHRRESMPELAVYRDLHQQAAELSAEVAVKAAELKAMDLEADRADGELDLLEAKLKEHETRLFAGGMSARETEQMRLEVQSLRGQQEAMEAKVLGLLDLLDPRRSEMEDLNMRLQAIKADEESVQSVIAAAWKEIDREVAAREQRKAEASAPITLELMELYERLRLTKAGVAVGRLEHGVCGGCHLALSLPEQAEAAESDPPRCIHCLRILVM
jgi:predicted  nucleic acid-binding Zn-ribbon protein